MHATPTPSLNTRLAPADDRGAPRSELFFEGHATGAWVGGAVLEAAYAWPGFWLLFMTDDLPFEDMLSIHLLDGQFALLDTATLGAAYSTGSFSALPGSAPDEVRFRFIGDTDWTVQLLPRPVWRVPFFGEPRGVSRPPGLKRHFLVKGQPQAQVKSRRG